MVAFPRLFEVLKSSVCLFVQDFYPIVTLQNILLLNENQAKVHSGKLSGPEVYSSDYLAVHSPTHAHNVCWSHLTNSTVTLLAYHLHDVLFKYDFLSLPLVF